MKRINCKYAEFLIAPSNAIQDTEVVTNDGVECRLKYISTCNNKDGEYDGLLDDACQRYYGCSFSTIRSIWIGRLGIVDDYWNVVKMEKT